MSRKKGTHFILRPVDVMYASQFILIGLGQSEMVIIVTGMVHSDIDFFNIYIISVSKLENFDIL